MSLAEKVRAALEHLGETSAAEVAEWLGAKTYAERRRVRQALADLVKAGEVETKGLSHTRAYRLIAPHLPGRGGLQAKIWRAMLIKKPGFTAREVALLAGTTREYALRVVRFLKAQGFIEAVGRKKTHQFGQSLVYRVAPGKERETPPRYNRRAEEKKRRMAGETPALREAQGLVRGYLAEMRGAVEGVQSHCHQALAIVEEMERDLLGREVGNGKGPDEA